MANLPEDIQCVGSNTRPPMLDRTDFASWQQHIRLYCWGPERPRVYSDLSLEEKDRYIADIRATNILLQRLLKDIYTLINHYTDAKDIWDNVKMLLEGSELTKEDQESQLNIKMAMSRMQLNSKFVNNMLPEWGRFVTVVKLNRGLRDSNYDQLDAYLKQHETHANENKMMLDRFTQHTVDPLALMSNNRVGNANPCQARQVKYYNCNGIGHIARNYTQPKRPKNFNYYKDKMLLMQAQENGVALDEEHLLFFAADDCDVFDSNVDEAPMAQTMFMANLSSADPVNDETGPSYDSDILSEVHDHYHYQDAVCAHHEEHAMHDNVQLNHVVDSHVDYTSDSNIIMYDQYVKDNAVPVVHSNVSSIPNDAYMMIYNDMYEPHAQYVSKTSRTTIVENSLTAELATYKEQVELYERWVRKHDEIERKNLLIANDNLIAKCLSKEVFSVATNSELNVARLTKMHVANTIVEIRCLELEA
nr:hypothetical protein [Tanacetum cinerariifolium]